MSPRGAPLPSANELTPHPALVARFRRDLEAITGEAPGPECRLGLAVSGGPDSMAMLLLGAAAYPGAVRAATVDHGLRPEAAEEAAMVGAVCARLGVDHETLTLSKSYSFEGNLQERARIARYALLGAWAGRAPNARWVAVAHQRDDVAETFVARARRGSGLAGLAEMRRSRPIAKPGGALLVRPLLDWSRSELADAVLAAGVESATDPSNANRRFDRSRIRALLAATPELAPDRLARAAQNLRHAEDALEWWIQREGEARFDADGEGRLWLDPADLPYELRRRLLWRAIEKVRQNNGIAEAWRDTGLDRLLATLASGGVGTIAGVQARAIGGKWRFRLVPPRRVH